MPPISLKELRDEVQVRARDLVSQDVHPLALHRMIQHAYDSIYARIVRIDRDYFIKTATISFVADQQEYALPADFLQMRQVRRTGGVTDPHPLFPVPSSRRDLTSVTSVRWPYNDPAYVSAGEAAPRYYYISGKMIGFVEPPNSAVANAITLEYIPSPPRLSFGNFIFDSNDHMPIRGGLVDTTAYGAAAGGTPTASSLWKTGSNPGRIAGVDTISVALTSQYPVNSADSILVTVTTSALVDVVSYLPASTVSSDWGRTDVTSGGTVPTAFNLSGEGTDYVVLIFNVTNTAALASYSLVGARFCTSDDDYYAMTATQAQIPLRAGWNYVGLRRDSFAVTGNPSWAEISGCRVFFQFTGVANGVFAYAFAGFRIVALDMSGAARRAMTAVEIGIDTSGVARTIMLPEYSEASEWLVLESALRVQDTLPGMTEDTGRALARVRERRDEVRDNVLRLMADRQRQEMPRVRRRLWKS